MITSEQLKRRIMKIGGLVKCHKISVECKFQGHRPPRSQPRKYRSSITTQNVNKANGWRGTCP